MALSKDCGPKRASLRLSGADGGLLAARLVLQDNGFDSDFIDSATDGFAGFTQTIQAWTPGKTSKFCGIPEKDLRAVARLWSRKEGILSLWSMGVNQRREGTAVVGGLINLHLLTGEIGKAGAGIDDQGCAVFDAECIFA